MSLEDQSYTEVLEAELADADHAIYELCEAIRLTVEYTGTDMLPAIAGWSWFDALKKYAPDTAEYFVLNPIPIKHPGRRSYND